MFVERNVSPDQQKKLELNPSIFRGYNSCNPSSSYDAGSSDDGFQYETPTIHILVFMVELKGFV